MRKGKRRSRTRRASVHSLAAARERRRRLREARVRAAIDEARGRGIAPDPVEGEPLAAS